MIRPDQAFSREAGAALTGAGVRVTRHVRMSELTTFRLGGPCVALVDCPDAASLAHAWSALVSSGLNPLLIGGGSNLLVHDDGVGRVVVRYASEQARPAREGDELVVPACLTLDELARYCVEAGLDGLVSCSGIPGTVGGAIAGNAGAFGEQIGDRVVSVDVLDRSGASRTLAAPELGFAYRASRLQDERHVIVSARLRLSAGDRDLLSARRAEILKLRSEKHPDWRTTPTAGSFFKNIEPTSKAERRQAAGYFLEQAGALSMREGGARTFARHANIIIAEPGCRAVEVHGLSLRMAAAVQEKFAIALQREVKLVGFPEGAS